MWVGDWAIVGDWMRVAGFVCVCVCVRLCAVKVRVITRGPELR